MSGTQSQPKTTSEKKKKSGKTSRRKYPVKFDRSGFNLMAGVGILMLAVGALIAWASLTVPEGVGPSESNRASHRIVSLLPDSFVQWMATVLGFLFIAFGIFCLIKAISLVVKFLIEKKNEQASV